MTNRRLAFRVVALVSAAAAIALAITWFGPSGVISAAPKLRALAGYDAQVKPILAQMTLPEKIGQMTQPEQSALKDQADIENYFVGSLLSGGDSDPKEGNSLQAWPLMPFMATTTCWAP